jgi:hypothetical protein
MVTAMFLFIAAQAILQTAAIQARPLGCRLPPIDCSPPSSRLRTR